MRLILNGLNCASITLASTIFCVSVCAQSIRYSNFYDFDNTAGVLLDLSPMPDGKLCAVGVGINNQGLEVATHLVVDSLGNEVFSHAFSETNRSIKSRALLALGESWSLFEAGYYCDFSVQSPGYCDYYLARLDQTGDTIFTVVYERTDTCDVLLDMVQTRPNKIMLIGWTCNDTTESNPELMLIVVDTLGHELNRVTWGGLQTDYVHSGVVFGGDGDVFLVGYTSSFPTPNEGRTWVVKTDSIGNVKWYRTYSGSAGVGSSGLGISVTADQNLVIAGGTDNDGYLMKIDTSGNQIWLRRYILSGGQGLWSVAGLEDGNIVSCGIADAPSESQAGWLIKTNEFGDTIWTRMFDSSNLTDLFRNLLTLPNGDIVAIGYGRPTGQSGADGWVLRVDSMGCLEEGCYDVGIMEWEGVRGYFTTYPNPVIDFLTIEVEPSLELNISVVDITGKQFGLFYFPKGSGSRTLDVSDWPNGLYILKGRDIQGKFFVTKLVK